MNVDWNEVWKRPYGSYTRHHRKIWQTVLPFCVGKEKRVCDLGCGPALLWQGTTVLLVGVDSSQQALIEAKKNYPQGMYVCADVRYTGLPSHFFDTIVMFGLLDYFEHWNELIRETKRISRGRIFATLLHGYSGHRWNTIEAVENYLGYPPKQHIHPCGNWYLIEI